MKTDPAHHFKRVEEELWACEQAIQKNPSDANAYSEKGLVLSALKRYEEAVLAFDQAIHLDPGDHAASDLASSINTL